MYVDKLEHIVDKYSNKNRNEDCLCKVGHIYFDIVNNNKDPKFKHGDYFITSAIKTFLQIATLQIGLKNFFVIKVVKNTMARTYVIKDLNDEKFVWTFYEKESQKTNQTKLRIDIVRRKTW